MVIQKNGGQVVRWLHQCPPQSTTIQYISATILIYIYIHIPFFFTHPFREYCIHLIPMPRDEVNPSFITNKPRKRTLSSYVHNQDNISGDRDQYVKRIKQTVNPGMFPNNSYFSPWFYLIKTFRGCFWVYNPSQSVSDHWRNRRYRPST